MKVIPVIFLFFCFTSHGQKSPAYLVRYLISINTYPPDSINESIRKHAPSDTSDPWVVTVDLSEISFEATFCILADHNSSKFYLDTILLMAGVTGTFDDPDTAFYSADKWTKLQKGKLSNIEAKSFDFVKTNEVKEILGFRCTKYQAFDNKLEIWASDQLPDTLIPCTGLTRFNQAILELIDHTSNMKIIATSIDRL